MNALHLKIMAGIFFFFFLYKIEILNLCSKPQQLSTYALTLFNYKTEVNGQKVLVGKSRSIVDYRKNSKNWDT